MSRAEAELHRYLPLAKSGSARVHWWGLGVGRVSTNEYYRNEIRGRAGAGTRRLNDILIRVEGQVARLEPSTVGRGVKRPLATSTGLSFQFGQALGCSSPVLQARLEELDQMEVHLCRELGCNHGNYAIHVTEYAAVQPDFIPYFCHVQRDL